MKKLGLYLLIMVIMYTLWFGIPFVTEEVKERMADKEEIRKWDRQIYDVVEEDNKTIIILGKKGYSIEDDVNELAA